MSSLLIKFVDRVNPKYLTSDLTSIDAMEDSSHV